MCLDKYEGPVPMFKAQEFGQIKSTKTTWLSHERTTTLMRFGSVVAKSADLSRTLETIEMPLGMRLNDPLVHKRGRFQELEMPAFDVMLLLLYSKL